MTNHNRESNEMTLQEFESLLDRHGPALDQWRPAQRRAANRLLAGSASARASHDQARALDRVLDAAPAGEVHSALTARILASAPDAGARHDRQHHHGTASGSGLRGLAAALWPGFGWMRPAALLTLSLAAGLYVGAAYTAAPTADEGTDLLAYIFESPDQWETGEIQ